MAVRRAGRAWLAAVVLVLVAGGCTGGDGAEPHLRPPRPTSPVAGECGEFRIAYDPSNGYEASALVVGQIAEAELGCDVTYVTTTSRLAWRVVAEGRADVYLDAYGDQDLRERLAGEGGPVTVVGRSGFMGGVDLLAPYFMGRLGLQTYRDLGDDDIGWRKIPPAITTVPELVPVAQALIDNIGIDYFVRDFEALGLGNGMGELMQQPALANRRHDPGLYLVEAPRGLIGDGPSQISVQIPDSAGNGCEPARGATTCSLENFPYLKIANAQFAMSGSPAYSLVFNYRLERPEVENILDIVRLSGYDVGPADVASWVNTHKEVWSAWLA